MGSSFLIVLVLIFGAMYFLMIRPQRKQQAKQQDMLANLKTGDEVITVGGIYGDVVGVEPDRVSLEIAEDVEIEVARRAIAQIVQPEEDEDEAVAEDEDLDGSEPVADVERTDAEARAESEDEEPEPAREEARR